MGKVTCDDFFWLKGLNSETRLLKSLCMNKKSKLLGELEVALNLEKMRKDLLQLFISRSADPMSREELKYLEGLQNDHRAAGLNAREIASEFRALD